MIGSRDYRDDCIEQLTAENLELVERVSYLAETAAFAEIERDAYRLVAVAGIHHAYQLQTEVARMRDRHERTLDEYRSLRASLLPQGGSNRAA